jgi:hypothetical protein
MHQIDIEGKFHDEYLKIHREIPSSWSELNQAQLLQWAEVLTSGANRERFADMLLYRWLKLDNSIFFNLDKSYRDQMGVLLNYLVLENNLDKVLIKEFNHEGETFLGPADAFKNFSFLEWVRAESAFTRYQKTKKDEDIWKVFYCMYRPQRKNMTKLHQDYKGDLRELINDHTIDELSLVFSTLSRKMQMALLMIYIGNRNAVIQRFGAVFEYATEKKVTDMYGSVGVIVGMVGEKWGTRSEIERANAYEVFISWHQNIERLEEFEREKNNT